MGDGYTMLNYDASKRWVTANAMIGYGWSIDGMVGQGWVIVVFCTILYYVNYG